jgi:hypothetical protein
MLSRRKDKRTIQILLLNPSEVDRVGPALVPTLKVQSSGKPAFGLTIVAGERSKEIRRPDRTAIYDRSICRIALRAEVNSKD